MLAELDGEVVGYATSLVVRLTTPALWPTYLQVTGDGTFCTHDLRGDTLYGADIAVHPAYRGRGISTRLYAGRKKLMKELGLRRMLAYGRIPGYIRFAQKMTARQYVARVIAGRIQDPSLRAHLRAGYRVVAVEHGLMRDGPGLNHCTILEMPNPAARARDRMPAPAFRSPAPGITLSQTA